MRYIALPEFQRGLVVDVMPPYSYVEKTNGTLLQENCRLTIDENGFMVSERSYRNGDSKILLLGGSAIENLYIRQDRRILSRIEEMSGEMGKNVKVYNAAISNAHLLHIVNIMLNKGIALRPTCVVYYVTPGLDVMANEVDNSFWNPAPGMTPIRKKGQEELKIEYVLDFRNKNNFEDEKRLLRTLHEVCRNFNIALFVATWPVYGIYDEFMQKQQPDRVAFDAEEAQTANLNAVIRDFSREKGCKLIDLERIFADLDHGRYFYDWNHPNVEGCELIASVTSRAVQSVL
jgi:hypothetical protein